MITINIRVRDQILAPGCLTRLVIAGSRKQVYAKFDLDQEWDGLTVTANFANDMVSGTKSVILPPERECEIPPEVLENGDLHIGLDGIGPDGYKLTTKATPWALRVYACGPLVGLSPEEQTPEIWEQILAIIGPMDQLDTTNKDTLVDAINEVLSKTGYTLPAATADALGGVQADPAMDGDTQPVRIGPDNKLVTAPAKGYTLPAATADALGGVQADPAQDGDTQPVRIGPGNKLVTAPAKEYSLPVATADALGGVQADPAKAGDTQPVRIGPGNKLVTAPAIRDRVILDTGELKQEVSMLGPIDLSRCRRVRIIGKAYPSPNNPGRRGAQLIYGSDINRRLALDVGRGKLFNKQGSAVGFCVLLDRWENTVTALSCSGFNAEDLFAEQPPFSGFRATTFDGVTMLHTEAMDYSNLYLTAMDDFAGCFWGVGTRVLVLGEETV